MFMKKSSVALFYAHKNVSVLEIQLKESSAIPEHNQESIHCDTAVQLWYH